MKWIHPEDLRSAENRALSEGRGDNDFWIREAGAGLADRLRTLLLATGQPRPPVLAVVGPGKNGLDGLVALTALARQGFPCHAWLLSLDDSPFRLEAESSGLYLSRQTRVISVAGQPPKRLLMEFTRIPGHPRFDDLVIGSAEYRALTGDFYL